MTPIFRLQIVDERDQVVVSPFAAGRLEIDLIEACVTAILAKGVGLARTQAHVAQDIRDGMREAIQTLKEGTRPLVLRR